MKRMRRTRKNRRGSDSFIHMRFSNDMLPTVHSACVVSAVKLGQIAHLDELPVEVEDLREFKSESHLIRPLQIEIAKQSNNLRYQQLCAQQNTSETISTLPLEQS